MLVSPNGGYPLQKRVKSIPLFLLGACLLTGLPKMVRGRESSAVHGNVIVTVKQGKLSGLHAETLNPVV